VNPITGPLNSSFTASIDGTVPRPPPVSAKRPVASKWLFVRSAPSARSAGLVGVGQTFGPPWAGSPPTLTMPTSATAAPIHIAASVVTDVHCSNANRPTDGTMKPIVPNTRNR
jgi:hypothetical protein